MTGARKLGGHSFRLGYVAAVLVFIYLPVAALILFAFQSSSVPVPPFDGPSLRWFEAVFADRRMTDALRNSLLVGAASSAIATAFGMLAAYATARYGGPWLRRLQGLFLLPLTISYIIVGMGLLITLMWFQIPKSLGAVILGHAVMHMPIAIALISSQIKPDMLTLERAARDLGAKEWQVIAHVVMPSLTWPMVAAFLLCFTLSWDEFIIALLLSRFDVTLPVEIWSQLRSGLNPKTNAIGSVVFMASAVLVIFVEWIVLMKQGKQEKSQ
ncbi:ABC transporter permease [Methyloligella sp. 2.7D]|uniref:ABC transporter permease n=1 Tax=unclassified Methyloligella TaxID=2625955 RepID=UPI00157DA098|nr:ABC transporter permease [Methyloligella sp. GL2]QKP77927.1 ABC transporter permease [Methyloligella sp. GL2]